MDKWVFPLLLIIVIFSIGKIVLILMLVGVVISTPVLLSLAIILFVLAGLIKVGVVK